MQLKFSEQYFANEYQLVNGVELHRVNGPRFQIPPDVIKRHVVSGYFIELRIDSPRFSAHAETASKCSCPACNGELSKPILRHEQPESLVPFPVQDIPSRGWGEDFWVQVTERDGCNFQGTVDNTLVETRLHGISRGDRIHFQEDHILAVHPIHRADLVRGMDEFALKELASWLRDLQS